MWRAVTRVLAAGVVRPVASTVPATAHIQRATMAAAGNKRLLRELREKRLREREQREAAEREPEILDFSPQALKCDLLTAIEREEMFHRLQGRPVPRFYAGSTLKITYKPNLDMEIERHSVGLCIARANRKLGSSFTLRNVENGIAYEQKWELYSPHIQKIEVLELARRRRAKLYYMRNRPAKESLVNPRMQAVPVPEGPVPVKRPVSNRKTRRKRLVLRQQQLRRTKGVKARTAQAAKTDPADK